MNQTELKKAVAESSGISRDTVERCFEALRSVALRELQKVKCPFRGSARFS
jgi:nucleoid DNA-binding protein